MTYRGRVQNGVIVLEGERTLADGTIVRVEPIDNGLEPPTRSLSSKLADLAGRASGLPADLARRHDHYLHGTDES